MTSWLESVRWDLLGGGFQIALCAGVLFSWVRRRIRSRSGSHAEPGVLAPVFSREVFLQTIRQETEHAMQTILTAVETERNRLQRALEDAGASSVSTETEIGTSVEAPVVFRWGDRNHEDTGPNRYDGLEKFIEQGLSSRQIADRMNLPAGEIELAMKLRGRHAGTDQVEAIRQ